MFFRDVIGQEEIKQRLIQEVNEGRIPHAQLICGPEGVGKMPLAIAYAIARPRLRSIIINILTRREHNLSFQTLVLISPTSGISTAR